MPAFERSLTNLALQTLKQAIVDEIKYEYNWFHFFGFKDDPTDPKPVTKDFDNALVDRQREVKIMARILASTVKGGSAVILLSGSMGSGRTSLVNFLLHLNELARDEGVRYHMVSVRDLVMYKPDKIADYFEKNVPNNAKLLIMEDCEELGEHLAEVIRHQAPRDILKLVVTTPAHLLALRGRENDSTVGWRTAQVSPLNERDAMSFVRTVLTRSMEQPSRYSSVFDSEAALKMICEYGMGVPGLILELLKKCFLLAYQKDLRKLDRTTISEVVTKQGFDAALKYLSKSKLSEKLFEVLLNLHFMTNFAVAAQGSDGVTANELEEELEVDRSTVVHYLSQLHEMGLLAKHKRGKLVYYALPSPTRVALELECARRIE